jgi:hypothetical protein
MIMRNGPGRHPHAAAILFTSKPENLHNAWGLTAEGKQVRRGEQVRQIKQIGQASFWILFCVLLFCDRTAPGETKDTITFTNGEQLIGKLVKVVAGNVTFHSDTVGDITVPLAKVKTLHAAQFAVVAKGERLSRKTAESRVPVGAVALEDGQVKVATPGTHAGEKPIAAKNVDTVIDAASFRREVQNEQNFLYGWTGSVTLGASLVEATNSAQTYTGSATAVRTIPTIPWLPPASKTTFDVSGTYGLAKDPEIISGTSVIQAPSITKTDILHGDAEYDRYVSPRVFGLVNASADHNFGNGLQLQQAYGGGVGWSVVNSAKNNLALKADLQYVEQQFYNGITSPLGTPDENLVGLAVNETWSRNFAHNVKFNEYVTLTPTFNVLQAYSAVANANFVFPVYKKLNFTVSSTDNYLGDPPEGYLRNSFQFTAGVTYVVK